MTPRVLIFGTGSVGATYAYVLSRALPAKNIVTICRSNYEAALRNGLTINSAVWGKGLNCRPTVVRSVTEAVADKTDDFDYAIICSKAIPSKPSAAETLKPAIGPKTSIVLVQNGISTENEWAKLYPTNPLLSCTVYLPVTQSSPGVIEHGGFELLHVGTYPADAEQENKRRAKSFVELITAAGATAKLHDDVQYERWSKLLVNASWNPICALTRLRDKPFLESSPEAEDFLRDTMAEIAEVARACGYTRIDADTVNYQVDRATSRPLPGLEPSMLADALASRNMEVEAIVKNVVQLAKQKNVNTPILRTVQVLLQGLDYSFSQKRG